MFLRAFPGISCIPVKACYLPEANHRRILSSYTLVTSNNGTLHIFANLLICRS
jgi:hypothetical protein